MNTNTKFKITFFILFLSISVSVFSQVKLPKLISDGMVLQRDTEIKIWGWAKSGEKISVNFLDSTYSTVTNEDGDWIVLIQKTAAGGPYEMNVKASNSITIKDILIGDVWICSGQSNMELTMQRVSPIYGSEIADSENPDIRYFEVPDTYNFNDLQKDISSGEWKKTNPENILSFSATSYFFGKELYAKYNVPVGLINAALGGSPAESWISEDGLKEFPEHYNEAQKFKDSTLIQQIQNEDRTRMNNWYNQLRKKDQGYSNPELPWFSPDYDPLDWSKMKIPGYWADENPGFVNGVVWFRKEINIPESMAEESARLNLGRIIDADSVFVNGIFVGTTSYQYPPRRYTIPENVLKEGKNNIVIRVISNRDRGGFAEDKPYEIIGDEDTIDLKGDWQYKLGAEMKLLKGETFIRWKPLGLYNAMIAPLLNYNMNGVIWYQGESNAGRPLEYKTLFPALIKNWRKNWGQGDFPFIYVQLPNFMEAKPQPSESNWALLREAQSMALSLPNTGMAVAIDIGEWNDIHPLNKKDVGKRLALAAQKVAYGEDIVYSGPVYQSMQVEDKKVVLTFSNTGSGLMVKDADKLEGFAIAGADKNFIWANAKIEGDKVVVWHNDIPNPVTVRYAWADNPAGANLYNIEGLPVSPFRTDEF